MCSWTVTPVRTLVDPAFSDSYAQAAARAVLASMASSTATLTTPAYASYGGFAYPATLDERDVVVKVTLREAHEHLEAMIAWALHAGDPWLAPVTKPVVWADGSLPLLVSVWPKGEPGSQENGADWVDLGVLLGRLHHQQGCGTPAFDPRAGLQERIIGIADGQFASLATLAAARLGELSNAWEEASRVEPHAVCHGDPHPGQLVRFTTSASLIDADRSGDGPAVSDLAFAWCFEQAGHLAPGVWDALVSAYVANAPGFVLQGDDEAGVLARVLPFARLHLLRRALGLALRHLRGDQSEKTKDVLAAVDRCLG